MLPQLTSLSTLAGFTGFVAAHPRAVLVTVDDLGVPRGTQVQVQASDTGDLRLHVAPRSRAAHDLATSRRVCLLLGDVDAVCLQVEGLAPRSLADTGAVTDQDADLVVVRPTWLRWSVGGEVLEGAA